jgi:hypothetical protein
VLNGPAARRLDLHLGFLGKGRYRALWARDVGEDGAGLKLEEREAGRDDTLELSLRAGGGVVARFSRR